MTQTFNTHVKKHMEALCTLLTPRPGVNIPAEETLEITLCDLITQHASPKMGVLFWDFVHTGRENILQTLVAVQNKTPFDVPKHHVPKKPAHFSLKATNKNKIVDLWIQATSPHISSMKINHILSMFEDVTKHDEHQSVHLLKKSWCEHIENTDLTTNEIEEILQTTLVTKPDAMKKALADVIAHQWKHHPPTASQKHNILNHTISWFNDDGSKKPDLRVLMFLFVQNLKPGETFTPPKNSSDPGPNLFLSKMNSQHGRMMFRNKWKTIDNVLKTPSDAFNTHLVESGLWAWKTPKTPRPDKEVSLRNVMKFLAQQA